MAVVMLVRALNVLCRPACLTSRTEGTRSAGQDWSSYSSVPLCVGLVISPSPPLAVCLPLRPHSDPTGLGRDVVRVCVTAVVSVS